MATNMDLLVACKECGNIILNLGDVKYSNTKNNKYNIASLKTSKPRTLNCAWYVSLACQMAGLLKPNQGFYFTGKINYMARGSYKKSDVEAMVKQNFTLIKVCKKWKDWKANAKPGDICGWEIHTNVYAGHNEKGDIWYDGGKSSTTDGKAESGVYKKIHRAINKDSNYLYYVLRCKSQESTTPKTTSNTTAKTTTTKTTSNTTTKVVKTTVSYYKKYTGKSIHVDSVFKAIGVPSKYIGSATKRKAIAIKNSISNYKGTADQNKKLISLAKNGKLKKV